MRGRKGRRRLSHWLTTTFGLADAEHAACCAQQSTLPPQAETTAQQAQAPPVGAVLNKRYRLDELIGKGGAAAVYRGYDLALDHLIAVKVLLLEGITGRATESEFKHHLRSEARAAMRLSHPLIARVYTYQPQDPWEYLIMEFVPGRTLRALARARKQRRLEVHETIQIGLEVLEALAYAHEQGVIHNDISPRNILVDDHQAIKVCDFGLSRLLDLQISRAGRRITGTAAYMSPERIRGLPFDGRSDLYSLGATLYAISSGRAPFGTRANDAFKGHTTEMPPPSPHLPQAFQAILHKALEKDPAARFAEAREMANALAALLRSHQGAAVSPHRETTPEPQRVVALLPTEPSVIKQPGSAKPRAKPPPDMGWITPRKIELEGKRFEVEGFYMDHTPITNAQYEEFVRAQGALPPAWWHGSKPPKGKLDHPVVGITIAQARRYAAWHGKRLPTTLEWLAVVRGEAGCRQLPWGASCIRTTCHCPRDKPQETAPVNAHPSGASPEGCMDLLGNVWEWTEVDPRFAPTERGYHYVMGGSYRHSCRADEGVIPQTSVSEYGEYLYLGFRCARDKVGCE